MPHQQRADAPEVQHQEYHQKHPHCQTSGVLNSTCLMNSRRLVDDTAFFHTPGAVDHRDVIDIMNRGKSRGIFAIQVLHVL